MNLILRKRIICLIAMSYSIDEEELWKNYGRINNVELLLNLLETNKLDEFFRNKSR